jgi:hypothetical protein
MVRSLVDVATLRTKKGEDTHGRRRYCNMYQRIVIEISTLRNDAAARDDGRQAAMM